jgi:hypothetical protein
MATAGAITTSAVEAEDATSPDVETAADVLTQRIVDVGRRQYALAAAALASIPQQREVAHLTARPTPQQRVVAPRMARPMPQQHMGVSLIVAANTISPWREAGA